MKGEFKRIAEARLAPDKDFIQGLDDILKGADADYEEWVQEENNGRDDIEELIDFLDANNMNEMPIAFHCNNEERADPNEWASAVADWTSDGGKHVDVILHARNIEGYYNLEDMREVLLKMIAHETIHFNQYDHMGKEGMASYKSGHQKGTELKAKGGTERDWMRSYLRDKHEIMAYGRDLAVDIADMKNPQEVMRNVEGFKNELPVYQRYRHIFDKNAPQIKALLKYASQYLTDLLKEKEIDDAELNEFKESIKRIIK
ncbi:MAG: hypothetical protein DRH08_03995 [Deltaproteobacteria bacterium]|nr:MAG: hypothetical protein DRH08_03995 [Deltaproteobacteria bacterium]